MATLFANVGEVFKDNPHIISEFLDVMRWYPEQPRLACHYKDMLEELLCKHQSGSKITWEVRRILTAPNQGSDSTATHNDNPAKTSDSGFTTLAILFCVLVLKVCFASDSQLSGQLDNLAAASFIRTPPSSYSRDTLARLCYRYPHTQNVIKKVLGRLHKQAKDAKVDFENNKVSTSDATKCGLSEPSKEGTFHDPSSYVVTHETPWSTISESLPQISASTYGAPSNTLAAATPSNVSASHGTTAAPFSDSIDSNMRSISVQDTNDELAAFVALQSRDLSIHHRLEWGIRSDRTIFNRFTLAQDKAVVV